MFRNVAISSLALALVACGNGNDAAETPQPVASDTGATTEAEASNTVAPASSAATPSAETNLPKAKDDDEARSFGLELCSRLRAF